METTLKTHMPKLRRLAPVALVLIMALSAALHLYRLDEIGYANSYYTAAVKSMLQSWHNFFFAAAEPGGSVTVDKPPLGLWIEAASAFVFGVNGFAVVLPNILAGVLSLPVLYAIVQKRYGAGVGLLAALALAVTPVSVAVQRNNTMDGMLTFCLVLTAWAFLRAAETGRVRYLWLGAVLGGLGFNIKMLQAFVPMPAFYAVYFLGARSGWGRKLLNLAVASVLLFGISLAWPVAVDVTPADQRPYIGSSDNNTVMELIIGHNGLNRLLGRGAAASFYDDGASAVPEGASPDDSAQDALGSGGPSRPANSRSADLRSASEIGDPGVLRFFSAPLSKEASWLLPLALVAMVVLAFGARLTLPLGPNHQMLVLWGGWLVTGLVFFSFASFFHAYYLVMLGPPLAVLVGSGLALLWRRRSAHPWLTAIALVLAAGATAGFQAFNAGQFIGALAWLPAVALLLLAGSATVVLTWTSQRQVWPLVGVAALVVALLITPAAWAGLTVTQTNDSHLPSAYSGTSTQPAASRAPTSAPAQDGNRVPGPASQTRPVVDLAGYLASRTVDASYMVAVPSSMQGAELVLATGRPVLYMGGFNGSDPVVSTDGLAALVEAGDLRYVLLDGAGGQQRQIANWVRTACSPVHDLGRATRSGPAGTVQLYECGG